MREISQLKQNNEFIIYNHAIPDSRDYHIKMHMKITSEINIPNFANTIKNKFVTNPELNTAQIRIRNEDDDKFDDDEFNETYLFYHSHQDIDYTDIDSILDSISRPPGQRGGGKKTKRQKDKKSKKTKRQKDKKI